MASDRRHSDNRRSDPEVNDRRKKNDRRGPAGRRNSEKPEAGSASRSARKKVDAKNAKSSTFKAVFRKVAIAFMLFVAIFTFSIIYFFANLDYYMEKVGHRVQVSLEKANLDPESLTDRTTRARLTFRVINSLPFEVILQNLNFTIHLSGYTIGKGMQISPKALIARDAPTRVAVACNVDSIMTRRGLQKAVEKQPAAILKVLAGSNKVKNDQLRDDIKELLKIEGSVDFRLKAAGLEIPFTRKVVFDSSSKATGK